ncbi:MAG TPA: hypothetical protein VKD72_34015 [Gemmataceae bacterium]|nr:hypothetical protein [Gemmataceae bacterium]
MTTQPPLAQLSRSGAPAETRSYTATMYDPDAPSGSGFRPWAVADIPASVSELPTGAGDGGGSTCRPERSKSPMTCSWPASSAARPPGNGRHRYVSVVQAIDVRQAGKIGVQADSPPAWLGLSINSSRHLLDRAAITWRAEIPAA